MDVKMNTLSRVIIGFFRSQMAEVGGRKSVEPSSDRQNCYEYGSIFPWLERRNRLAELSVFKQPQPLISVDETGHLILNDDVMKEIDIIDVPISVVAIAGLYRTGKSYLMNRIAGKSAGFSMGHTIKSHTKGIWVWCVIHPDGNKHVLALLDTEGLADPNKMDKEYDEKVFSLTVLLSSTLIYNMIAVLNSDAIEKLSFITKLSSNIQSLKSAEIDENENKVLIGAMSPTFILCLRDFYLQMEDEDNEEMTADQYLESCLKNDSKTSETTQCIKKYFPDRKCFRIGMPVLPNKLTKIATIEDKELDEDFLTEIESLKQYVYTREPKHLVAEKAVDGSVFGELVRTYVDAIRCGSKLNMQEAYCNASEKNNTAAVQRVTEWLKQQMRDIALPIQRKEALLSNYFKLQDATIRKYRHEAFISDEKFEDLLIAQLKTEWDELRRQNTECIQALCREKLEVLHRAIMSSDDAYNYDGGYKKFKNDLLYLETNFFTEMRDYDRDELIEALQVYKDSMKEQKMEIHRRESVIKDTKHTADMEARLEKRLQEKSVEIETEKRLYLEKERRLILDRVAAQTKANADTLMGLCEEVNKRTCVVS